mmetsp:Transcript_40866/g.94099  ORF Transcript_40866/g.94099 Transcript_40866/m.94099 type:complete len:258 (-) Transcript_40866:76-849(-)
MRCPTGHGPRESMQVKKCLGTCQQTPLSSRAMPFVPAPGSQPTGRRYAWQAWYDLDQEADPDKLDLSHINSSSRPLVVNAAVLQEVGGQSSSASSASALGARSVSLQPCGQAFDKLDVLVRSTPTASWTERATFIHFSEEFPTGRRSKSATATCRVPATSGGQRDAEGSPLGPAEAHRLGACHPCAYFRYKRNGCRRGDDCTFCHLCPRGEVRKRKKAKCKALRAAAAAAASADVELPDEDIEDGSVSLPLPGGAGM